MICGIMKIIDQEIFSNEILQDQTWMLYIVDFFAEWCGPCKMLVPVLEQLEAQFGDKICIVKIDIDSNQEIAEEYQIMSIPLVMVFRNGVKLEQVSGLKSIDFWSPLIEWLTQHSDTSEVTES